MKRLIVANHPVQISYAQIKWGELARMPIVWRFLLGQYFKLLVLSVVAFVFVLVTTRLDELAQFAILGAESTHIWLFALYQIPYILPIALSLSALIAALLLMQRLCSYHELIALRACGYGLGNIAAPILLASFALGIGNFYVVSELATYSHMMKRALVKEIKSMNPLVLLQNPKMAKLKGIYIAADGGLKNGEYAENLVLSAVNPHTQSLDLFTAKQIQTAADALKAEKTTLISTYGKRTKDSFGSTYVENTEQLLLPTRDLSGLLGTTSWHPKDDYLTLGLLFARLASYRKEKATVRIHRIYSEVMRRLSLGLAAITFTFMGLAYGGYSSPQGTRKQIFAVIFLSAMALACFFAAKSQHKDPILAAALYFLPQLIIIAASLRMMRAWSRGVIA